MKKTIISIFIVILVIITGFYLSDNKPDNRVRIGVILPLSGQYAFIGEPDKNAMILAKEELKAQNIDLIFEDDNYNAKTGISAYKKLKEIDKANVIVSISAPVIEALKPLVQKDNILMFTLGESLFHEDDTIFQLMPAGDDIFPTLGRISAGRYKHIALVYNNGSLWTINAGLYKQSAVGNAKVDEFKMQSDSDFRTEAKKVMSTNPDAVTAFMPLEDAIRFLKEIKILDIDHKTHVVCEGNMLYSIDKYVEALGPQMFEGCLMTSLPNTFTDDFVKNYKNKFGSDPVLTSDYAYDSVSIVEDLISKNNNISKWPSLLKEPNYSHTGASGEIKFNQFGTRKPAVQVYEFRNGRFVGI